MNRRVVSPSREVQDEARARAERLASGLFAHQVEGVAFLLGRRRAILADDVGLGKTRQSIVALTEMLVPGERHSRVVLEVVQEVPHLAGNLLHDAATAVLMREHGVRRICTRDTDFHRFPFVEPIDPLSAEP